MNLQQIKAAVAAGLPVHWSNAGYVVKGNLITFTANDHSIGLTHLDGVTLNGKECEFFIGDCPELRAFIAGYTECMLWSSHDTLADGTELEDLQDYELAPETVERVAKDCRAFVESNLADLQLYAEQYTPKGGYNVWECAGHDFWLTRNGHGVGFWDRGLDDLGQRLTAASHSAGSVDAYLGDDDEKVYLL